MSEISSALYWSMPGPLGFLGKVSDAARNARALFLSFPEFMPVNPMACVERALKDANVYEPITLIIQDGVNISAEIGTHFGIPNMPAQALAHHCHGAQHAIILDARGKRAQEHCEKYAGEFVQAIDDAAGDVRLVVALRNGDYKKDASNEGIQVICFDGGLRPSEMDAYVAQRMVSYSGPGTTNLYKHLVREYASFDPVLAERLSRMDPSQLMDLPNSLTALLSEELLRWSKHSWLAGTQSGASKEVHPLHEWYVAIHSGPEASNYKQAAAHRFWKACLKAIIPWLEERRLKVIDLLDGPLTQVEHAAGGKDRIQKRRGTTQISVTRTELEYNDIAHQSYGQAFNSIALTNKETSAISICRIAKNVRDDLSHLRPPKVADIGDLISGMDVLVPD